MYIFVAYFKTKKKCIFYNVNTAATYKGRRPRQVNHTEVTIPKQLSLFINFYTLLF